MIEIVKAHAFPGYLPDMAQPALVAEVLVHPARKGKAFDLAALDRLFLHALPEYEPPADLDAQHPLLGRVAGYTDALLRGAGMPVFSAGRVVGRSEKHSMRLAVPALGQAHAATGLALNWVVRVINQSLAHHSTAALLAELPALCGQIKAAAPRGMNSLRFLQAAHDLDMPWRRVAGNVYQFGWGARARWLDSSFTDATPNISARLSRDKRMTASILRQAGIPVPDHGVAANAEQAVKLAQQLGYPVVVKPADQDGGRGVSAGLKCDEAVRKAFAKASILTRIVLVEKHFAGNDYRVHVFQGEVYYAAHRVPGGVTGDGTCTVAGLLAIVNADPRRGTPGSNALLKRIDLDKEALELLVEQGLNQEAVPDKGRFVHLRRAANVASGGVPVPALAGAHPDNLALAVRAARVLRLDLAGVDLLIPDIRRSWLETGAAICEVNAQPQLAPHLPAYLLQRLVDGKGRIPVVMVLGKVEDEAWLDEMVANWSARGACVGVATSGGVKIDTQIVVKGPYDAHRGGVALICDPQVESAIICVEDERMLRTGLPVDRFDVLVLAGPAAAGGDAQTWASWQAFAQTLALMCHGPVIINQDCDQWVSLSRILKNKRILAMPLAAVAAALPLELERAEL